MNEAAITYSPHAFVPKPEYTEEEKKELYQTRVNESFKPYTVIDVLTKVYHRNFSDDLKTYIGDHPKEFQKDHGSRGRWAVSNVWVSECRVIRPESIFEQYLYDFHVDIVISAKVRLEEVIPGYHNRNRNNVTKITARLRYCLDLQPCHLSCRFEKVVTNEKEALINKPGVINVDKYLLPVLKGTDYSRLADFILKEYFPEVYGKDERVDPGLWLKRMNTTVCYGFFPEEGVLGEYFFGFGNADIFDPKTGEAKNTYIDPGTVVVNHTILQKPEALNSTLAHEGAHKFFATPYFMLQKTHGHDYCSYMCKRGTTKEPPGNDKWNPVDIMEMQANKFPAYLMIQEEPGKEHAKRLLESYGGERSLENISRLVSDMAEYYGTTKTMARTRLVEFGYIEARGFLQSVSGNLVPSYMSNLKDTETYTIDEADGIKEYSRNDDFRQILSSGQYIYVEGHYCLKDKKYVFADQFGAHHLTYYAREHMDECCLVFRRVYENTYTRIINGVLQKGSGRGRQDVKYSGKNGESPLTEEGKRLRMMIERQMAESGMLQMSFNQMTVELMKQKKMTIQKLADETGLSEETIKNMRNDPARIFQIKEIVAVCIAMHLSPETSEIYIKAGPSKFLSSTDMMLYQYALHQWYTLPVDVVNRRLVEAGAKPLTSLVEGYDENGVKLA